MPATRDPRHSCTETSAGETSTPEAWVQGDPPRLPPPGRARTPGEVRRDLSTREMQSHGPVRRSGPSRRQYRIPECERGRAGGAGALPGPMLRGTPSRSRTSSVHERPRIKDCRHRGPGSAPAPPARPPTVTRTNARVACTAGTRVTAWRAPPRRVTSRCRRSPPGSAAAPPRRARRRGGGRRPRCRPRACCASGSARRVRARAARARAAPARSSSATVSARHSTTTSSPGRVRLAQHRLVPRHEHAACRRTARRCGTRRARSARRGR